MFENLTEAEQKRANRIALRLDRIEFRLQRAQEAGNADEIARLNTEKERRELELRIMALRDQEHAA